MVVELDGDDAAVIEDGTAVDVVGHGTACAGIIHALAPGAELVSIRVLGPDNRAKGHAFAAALEWVVQQGIGVANLSLSSRSEALAGLFHELADGAYFANTLLVCAANNVAGPVLSVAVRRGRVGRRPRRRGPGRVVLQPVAAGRVRGVRGRRRRRLARRRPDPCDRQLVRGAAPGRLAALIRARHPEATPFEVKTILAATATPVDRLRRAGRTADALGRRRRFEGRVLEVAARPGVGTSWLAVVVAES